VIGNQDEIRYAHPLEDRIGKQMVGDDNERALQKGESYVSRSKGSIGLSIRGKTPIIKDGEIVGVVSVGYLLDDINTDRKSTRLNSSHVSISYAVFCLKKKKKIINIIYH